MYSKYNIFNTGFLLFFISIQDSLRLLVATEDGFLYIYNINSTEGGDMLLYKKFQLGDTAVDQVDEAKATGQDATGPGKKNN